MVRQAFSLHRRRLAISAALALTGASAGLRAQGYPTKPVRLILTNPPGGTVDTLARVLADELTRTLGQPFVIENRPGANGTLGGELVATSPPDGHTILFGPPGPIALNRLLYQKMPYDPASVFAPVSWVANAPLVLVAHPAVPVQTVAELIDYARSRPGQVAYASQGNGSSGHLAMELLASMAGISMIHIPYRGSAPALTDLIGGRVQFMFDNTTSSLPQVARGALKGIAVAERERLKAAPNIPTVQESGLRDFEATPWFGVVARAGTPRESIDRLSAAIAQAVNRPEVQARFVPLGVELRGTTPAAFAAHIASELVKWERIVKLSGAKLD